MKHLISKGFAPLAVGTLVVAALGGTAIAQGSGLTQPETRAATSAAQPGQSTTATTATTRAAGEHQVRRASRVIGADVFDTQGKKIGDVKDIVFDPARGQVAYAVVGFGGLAGFGTRYYAIPWAALHQSTATGDRFVMNMTRDQLKGAPAFERNKWPDMASEQWHRDVSRFYSQSPYWEGKGSAATAASPAGTMGGTGSGNTGGAATPGGAGSGGRY